MVSNPGKLIATNNLSKLEKMTIDKRNQIQTEMAAFFDTTVTARGRLGTVLPSFADVKELAIEIKTLSSLVDLNDMRRVEKMVNEACDILTILEENIKKDRDSEISVEAARAVSMAAFEMASYIDQIVVYYYNSISMISCAKLVFKQIEQLN